MHFRTLKDVYKRQFAICMNTDITFSLNTFAIGLGVGFSAAVGIIFGWKSCLVLRAVASRVRVLAWL